MSGREELKARIDGLSDTAIRFVARMVDSLTLPPTALPSKSPTWISGTPEWIEYFGLTLSVHHGTTVDALGLDGFETAFGNTCGSVEWKVERAESMTHRFSDIAVTDGTGKKRNLSLKSTAAQNLSKQSIHISKLTEAAWIQDVRSARDRQRRTLELFAEYSAAVDAIIILRAFRQGKQMPHRYQLVEIPTAIFESLQSAPVGQFDSDGPRISCSFGGHERAAQVSLDRSDAKITVSGIRLDVCSVHAEWEMVSAETADTPMQE